jgi:hypothetical protein
MGDNRTVSEDSRIFGPITRDSIIGRAWLRYFPLDRIGFIQRPPYPSLSAQADSSSIDVAGRPAMPPDVARGSTVPATAAAG